jgi:hypothetical protein
MIEPVLCGKNHRCELFTMEMFWIFLVIIGSVLFRLDRFAGATIGNNPWNILNYILFNFANLSLLVLSFFIFKSWWIGFIIIAFFIPMTVSYLISYILYKMDIYRGDISLILSMRKVFGLVSIPFAAACTYLIICIINK